MRCTAKYSPRSPSVLDCFSSSMRSSMNLSYSPCAQRLLGFGVQCRKFEHQTLCIHHLSGLSPSRTALQGLGDAFIGAELALDGRGNVSGDNRNRHVSFESNSKHNS